jgi:hypothetical protein
MQDKIASVMSNAEISESLSRAFQEFSVGLVTEFAEIGEIVNRFVDVEVVGLLIVVSVRRTCCSLK